MASSSASLSQFVFCAAREKALAAKKIITEEVAAHNRWKPLLRWLFFVIPYPQNKSIAAATTVAHCGKTRVLD